MSGGRKQRNPIARDLLTSGRYGPRIRETKRCHLIDELHRQDADDEYWEYKLGMAPKE